MSERQEPTKNEPVNSGRLSTTPVGVRFENDDHELWLKIARLDESLVDTSFNV